MATIVDTIRAGRAVPLRRDVESASALTVEREGIRLRTLRGSWVEVAVSVRNDGAGPTPPAPLRLAWADLGVRLPWRDLTTLSVPSLEAGAETVVGTCLPLQVGPNPRDGACGAAGLRRAPDGGLVLRPGLGLIQDAARAELDVPSARRGFLRPDLHALLGQRRPQWAGSLRVELGGRAVERHLAPAVAVVPGRDNAALFMVGRAPGTYRFRTRGPAADWAHGLLDLRSGEALPVDGTGAVSAVGEPFWMLAAVVRPPRGARRATLELVAQHEPSGDEQCVEFDLDPRAPGPHCVLAA